MARVITEKEGAVHTVNYSAYKMSAIDHLPLGESVTLRLQTHLPVTSSAVTNQSTCPRCGGLMVNEFYMDLPDSVGELRFPAKRCVQCGEVVDFVILLNRQQRLQRMTIPHLREKVSNNRMPKG